MKREIKFRAWNKLKGVMFDPMPIVDFKVYEINAVELMQYTGLKDKNGVEIYEGDFVKHNNNTYVVEWRDNMGMCFLDAKRYDGGRDLVYNKDNWRDWLWVYNVRKYIEVIGNIYQNTELISK